jgi:hypothetical protein
MLILILATCVILLKVMLGKLYHNTLTKHLHDCFSSFRLLTFHVM